MELKNFPMDRQSCPLIIGSCRYYLPALLFTTLISPSLSLPLQDGYTNQQLVYEWQNQADAVSFVPGMTLNQFDLINMMYRNFTSTRREGDFSVLHVAFNLKRHTGYFLIQVGMASLNLFSLIFPLSLSAGLCALHSDRGAVLGLLLDTP